eukprot:6186129-Pleurochrysis_carterae.AAC.1
MRFLTSTASGCVTQSAPKAGSTDDESEDKEDEEEEDSEEAEDSDDDDHDDDGEVDSQRQQGRGGGVRATGIGGRTPAGGHTRAAVALEAALAAVGASADRLLPAVPRCRQVLQPPAMACEEREARFSFGRGRGTGIVCGVNMAVNAHVGAAVKLTAAPTKALTKCEIV